MNRIYHEWGKFFSEVGRAYQQWSISGCCGDVGDSAFGLFDDRRHNA